MLLWGSNQLQGCTCNPSLIIFLVTARPQVFNLLHITHMLRTSVFTPIILSSSVICPPFSLIDGLARLGDKKIFSKLVEGVFNDGQINWGRIIVLFYAVGKLSVKVLMEDTVVV